MNDKYDPSQRINSVELMLFLYTVPIGVGVLGMARFIALKAGHDAPLATLVAGFYTQFGILFMWLLLNRFKKYGIYEIHQVMFGKWIGKLFNVLFAAYCLYAFFMTLRTFVELVSTWMFPMTQPWVLTGLFLVPIIYSSSAGLRLLGRFSVSVFFLSIWIVLLIYFPIKEGGTSHLFPIGANGIKAILAGSQNAALSLLGVELLMVIYPYVVHKPDVLPAASIASWGTTFVYTINSVVTIIFFSADQLEKTIWPMLAMFKHVQMPFIERFETIMIAFWVIQVVNTAGAYLWAGIEGVKRTMRVKKTWIYLVLVPTSVYMSTVIRGRVMINNHLNVLAKIGLAVVVVYPFVMWLIALILRKKGEAA